MGINNKQRSIITRRPPLLMLLSHIIEPMLLLDKATPQDDAFAWLLEEDELSTDFHLYDTLEQRYALAVSYFSMNGGKDYVSICYFLQSYKITLCIILFIH